jgi:phosphatidylethanolamine/phosphatidyl-N-methylethanolamine N-methyltransferase
MKMTNRWNRFIYRLWAPVYDATINRLFMPGRKRAMEVLALKRGESVLLVGVGTGADLPLLPPGVKATGVDLSAEMLEKAKSKTPLPEREISLIEGDAQTLVVKESGYDAILLNLILSVIPDAKACMRENLRALKPTGRVVIFDKFLPEDQNPSALRHLINWFSTLSGTDINRRLSELLPKRIWKIVMNEASIFNGTYRVILLKREV